MKSKITQNYMYTLLYQFITILTPLFITPYVSRVLGPEEIGIDAFVNSIVQMFMVFILLGIPIYGRKQIAQVKNMNYRETFSQVYSIQIFTTLIIMLIYIILIFCYGQHLVLFILYCFTLLGTGLDVAWYFVGKEEISKIMLRNMMVKIVTVVSIFLCVQTEEDLWLYILINGLSLLLGQIVTWFSLIRDIKGFTFTFDKWKEHFPIILVLSVVPCSALIYVAINKILLGYFVGETEVGFYNQGYKLYVMFLGFVTALSSILMPRMAKHFSKGEHEQIRTYIHFSIRFILLTTMPLVVGIILVAPIFVPWFLGEKFSPVSEVMMTMAPCFIVKGLGDIFGVQYLVIAGKYRSYVVAELMGALVSLVVCVVLLYAGVEVTAPVYALLMGTGVTLVFEMIVAREVYSIRIMCMLICKYTLFSILMGLVVFGIDRVSESQSPILSLCLKGIVGSLTYIVLLIMVKDPIVKLIINKIESRKSVQKEFTGYM
ncbi:oligosaccharide flippase family protein [Bacillus cereus]|uniref:oligosaccharide flippase family protein n=1 Tax=Bacillus cereus TaxID=1396 RepID=UPI0015971504|nr:oligosaccharide flippase family protein [Bacillus cereus]